MCLTYRSDQGTIRRIFRAVSRMGQSVGPNVMNYEATIQEPHGIFPAVEDKHTAE